MKRFTVIAGVFFIIYFQSSLSIIAEVKTLDFETAIEQLLATDREWAEVARGDDIDRICEFWAEDAVLYNLFGSGRRVVGKDAIKELLTANRAQPGRSLNWTPIEAFVSATGNIGSTRGTYEVTRPDDDGNKIAITGEYFNTWRRSEDGSWKCTFETHTADSGRTENGNPEDLSGRKAAAERFFRGVYGGKPDVVNELADDNIVASYPIFQRIFGVSTIRGIEAYRKHAANFDNNWTDAEITIHHAIAENDFVVLTWSFRARRIDSGESASASTAEKQSWGGITLFEFNKDNKITAEIGEESEPGPLKRLADPGN